VGEVTGCWSVGAPPEAFEGGKKKLVRRDPVACQKATQARHQPESPEFFLCETRVRRGAVLESATTV